MLFHGLYLSNVPALASVHTPTQGVYIHYHHGLRSQKTIPTMDFGDLTP